MFFFIYLLLSLFLYLIASPFLLYYAFKQKYKHSIPARFFLKNNTPLRSNGLWFHSCSFGEAKAIKPLIEAFPEESLRMTTTTQTGFSVISEYTRESRYLPFEPLLFFWQKPQKALIVMEAEFWYMLFALAKKKGTKTLLINARMSDKSFHKYLKMRWFYRKVFEKIDEVYAQTDLDAKRLKMLGAKNIQVTGNIKLSQLALPTKNIKKPKGLLVCAASTHEGEEALMLDAFLALKRVEKDSRLLLVPRHPERFKKVISMVESVAEKENMSWQKYSSNKILESDIVMVDMLGELINLYAVSDIVILGGSFEPIGGHNAAEAAQFECKIISGEHIFNQKDIFSAVENIAIVESSALSDTLVNYDNIKRTKIIAKSDISPIIESLKNVL